MGAPVFHSRRRLLVRGTELIAGMTLAGCGPSGGPSAPTRPATSAAGKIVRVTGTVLDEWDRPVQGAGIRALAQTVYADAAGRFDFGEMETTPPGLLLLAFRSGYVTTTVSIGHDRMPATIEQSFRLPLLHQLPIGSSVPGTVRPGVTGVWIGEPYDTTYVSNAVYFDATAPQTRSVRVRVDWDRQAGALVAGFLRISPEVQPADEPLVIPAGHTWTLVVGRVWQGSPLDSSVDFTLTAEVMP